MNKDDYGGPTHTSINSDMQPSYLIISVPKRVREVGLSDWFSDFASLDSARVVLRNVVLFGIKPYLFRSLVLWLG